MKARLFLLDLWLRDKQDLELILLSVGLKTKREMPLKGIFRQRTKVPQGLRFSLRMALEGDQEPAPP